MKLENTKKTIQVPYARHYNPRLVYILLNVSMQFIIKSGFKSRAGYIGAYTVCKVRVNRIHEFAESE